MYGIYNPTLEAWALRKKRPVSIFGNVSPREFLKLGTLTHSIEMTEINPQFKTPREVEEYMNERFTEQEKSDHIIKKIDHVREILD